MEAPIWDGDKDWMQTSFAEKDNTQMHSNGCLGCSFCEYKEQYKGEQWEHNKLASARRGPVRLTVKLGWFIVKAFRPQDLQNGVY